MGLLSLLLTNPLGFVMLAVPLLYSVIAHEVAHGWVASLFGDDTARDSGRLTLNPVAHLDVMGTIALFLVGFGWAKPVPVDYAKVRPFRAGLIVVSLAGCVVNILLATFALFILHAFDLRPVPVVAAVLAIIARVNIMLGSFNLIPIPPLDGSRILLGILPRRGQVALMRLEPFGLIALFILLFTGMLNPVIIGVQNGILSFIGLFLHSS